MAYEYILFDLDGTLADPKEGIMRSLLFALEKMGIEERDPDRLLTFIGPPLHDTLQLVYGLDEARTRQTMTFFRQRFGVLGIYENTLYPGVPEMLGELHRHGKRLALATSKPIDFAATILRHFGLDPFFMVVEGCGMDGSGAAKAEVIARALRKLGPPDPRAAVVVGDRQYEVTGARANGLHSIAVTWGYGTPDEIRAAGPTHVAHTMSELAALLLNGTGQRSVDQTG